MQDMIAGLILFYCFAAAALAAIGLSERSLRRTSVLASDFGLRRGSILRRSLSTLHLMVAAMLLSVLVYFGFNLLVMLADGATWAAMVLAALGTLMGATVTARTFAAERETGRFTHWRSALGMTCMVALTAGVPML